MPNKGSRNYTPEEMILIYENMQRNNIIVKPQIHLKGELFQVSATAAATPPPLDTNKRVSSHSSGRGSSTRHPSSASTMSGSTTWNSFNKRKSSSSSFTLSPPTSIPVMVPSLVAPIHLEWVYKDSSGVEQGPFTGSMMQEWYAGKWLLGSLQIRRAEEQEYYALAEFVERVGNYHEPFLVPLPPLKSGRSVTAASLVLAPEQLRWVYMDPSGVEQGPFDGLLMHEWFAIEWLKPDLMVRRVEEARYYSLLDLMRRLDNFVEPFLVPQQVLISQGE